MSCSFDSILSSNLLVVESSSLNAFALAKYGCSGYEKSNENKSKNLCLVICSSKIKINLLLVFYKLGSPESPVLCSLRKQININCIRRCEGLAYVDNYLQALTEVRHHIRLLVT